MPPIEELRFEIRPPWLAEAPLFRRLLPGAAAGADRLIAAACESRELLAAVAWTYVDDRAGGLLIQVRSGWRRSAVAGALVEAVIAACRHRGCSSLEAAVSTVADSPEPAVLLDLGFRLESTLTRVTIDGETQRAALAADSARFAVPAGYAFRDCPAAELAPLCRLWYSHDHPFTLLAQIANASSQSARCLYRGSRPIAFVFYTRTPETLTIDLWAADPAYRGTRANLALPASLVQGALADGIRELRFAWTTGIRHTPSFATRYAARTLEIQDQYVLRLVT